MKKYKIPLLFVALGLVEAKLLVHVDDLFLNTPQEIGTVLESSRLAYSRTPGSLAWSEMSPEQKFAPNELIRVRRKGQAHLRLGSATVFVPEENALIRAQKEDRIQLLEGSLWVLSNATGAATLTWKQNELSVLPSTQLYLSDSGHLQILRGRVELENETLERGAYVIQAKGKVKSQKYAVHLMRPQPIEHFYFWTEPQRPPYFSLPVRGAIESQGEPYTGTWTLALTDESGHTSHYQSEGAQMSQDFKVFPGRYSLQVNLANGQKSPRYVVHVNGLKSPQMIYPRNNALLLPRDKASEVFFLWKGDPHVNFYEISVDHDVMPVSYPLAFFSIKTKDEKEWTLQGRVRASHPQAGWSKPLEFAYRVQGIR